MITISWDATTTRTAEDGGDTLSALRGTLLLDGAERESFQRNVRIAQHPIEASADIADHIQPELLTFSVDCVVSAHPQSTVLSATENRPETVRATLRDLQDRGQIVSVETSVGTHERCIITAVSEQRTSQSGDGFLATIEFTEIDIVTVSYTADPSPRIERGRRRRDTGTRPTTTETVTPPPPSTAPADRAAARESALSQLNQLLRGRHE